MKKILGFMLCLAVCAGTATMEAKDYKKALQKQTEKAEFDAQKALIKARSKQCDQKIKQYEKEGWKIDGTAKSIRVAMMEYYNKINFDENYREMIGVAQCGTAKSRNVCQNAALNNAMVKYAQEAKSHVFGRVTSDVGTVGEQDLDNFYSAYERLVSAEINGELNFQFAVYKEEGGKREYEAYYLINEENASKRRLKAMQMALEESKAAQKYGEQISNFVSEGFNTYYGE